MNEQIKEFVKEAWLYADKQQTTEEQWFVEYNKKFAELLIQKCVAISDDYVKDCACEEHVNCKHPRSVIGRKIREHFGVE